MTLINTYEDALIYISSFMYDYLLVYILIGAGLYFTYSMNLVQFRFLNEALRIISGKDKDKNKKGVSSFQAFAISTASRVGTGNIAGVAFAISFGGPGAIFWMWLIALLSASTGFVESTLAQVYKVKDGDGFRGGPAYYIEKAIGSRSLGVFFAVLTAITFGLIFNQVHSNTVSHAFSDKIDPLWMGIVLSVLTLAVIFGGVNRIAKVSSFLMPILAGAYILVALFIILSNFSAFVNCLHLIFSSAFGIEPLISGTLGTTIQTGAKRGLFSNEAGMGSVPNAAATANTSHPVKQGIIQSFGVFLDTIIVSSATAFVIIMSGLYKDQSLIGIQLAQEALSLQIGDIAYIFLGICIFLFVYSSLFGNYYYGQSNIQYVTRNKIWLNIYRILVGITIIVGALLDIRVVWNLADIFMGIMALINIVVIFLTRKVAFGCLNDYIRQKKEGKEPVFYDDCIENLETECWKRP